MIYRGAYYSDLLSIVEIHRKLLGGMGAEFLPKLGRKCLFDLYAHLFSMEPDGFVVAQHGSNIVGFLVGVTDTRKMIRVLPKIFIKIIFRFYDDLEMNIFEFFSQGLSNLIYIIKRGKNDAKAELLDIAVDKEYQGKGMGTHLSLLFFRFLENHGVDKVQVLVDDRWKQALLFYVSIGFKPVKLMEKPNGNMWVMVKKIRNNNVKRTPKHRSDLLPLS